MPEINFNGTPLSDLLSEMFNPNTDWVNRIPSLLGSDQGSETPSLLDPSSIRIPTINTTPDLNVNGSSSPASELNLLSALGIDKLSKVKPPSSEEALEGEHKKTLLEKFNDSTFGKHFTRWSAGFDLGSDILGGMVNDSRYSGPHGGLVKGMDVGYDLLEKGAQYIPVVGKPIQLGMKASKMLSMGAEALLGKKKLDNMTAVDAAFRNPLTGWNLGTINALTGKNVNTLTKDEETQETVGAAYTGLFDKIDDFVTNKSGKRVGGFSRGTLHKLNREQWELQQMQERATDIANMATDRFELRNSMSAINGNRRAFTMSGGYDQSAVRVGRNGISIQSILAAKRAASAFKYRAIGKAKDPFEYYLSTLPQKQRSSKNFRVRDYWEFNGRPKDFNEAVSKGMFTQQEDGWHAKSVSENPETGEIEFMKSSSHPNHHMEVDWYYSDDGAEFRSQYELQKTEPYWKYVKRKPQGEAVGSYQEGGILEPSLSNIEEKHLEYISTIEEVPLDCILPEFKEGGKVNVIPEGALHARLHHMENAENLTKKGIPVVSEKEGGELEQQAEIERDEIIYRISVTKKLEDLYKIYYSDNATNQEKDEAAIEAGKLLVYETLYNTQDNTGILNKIN